MAKKTADLNGDTYPLRAASRLTGLTPDVLRAWERRYGVVQPLRTPGGTRRYRASDVERLRLVKAAVDAGHRISEVARLDIPELERRGARLEPQSTRALEEAVAAVERMDGVEAERLLSLQLATLGPGRFAREFAIPLVEAIGDGWAEDRLCVASEHLASGVLRVLLSISLKPTAASLLGPRILFATPSGERHELGLLMAAVAALGAGASPVYLGTELPTPEFFNAAQRTEARAIALSLVVLGKAEAERAVREIRASVPERVAVWIGGRRAQELSIPSDVRCMRSLEEFERQVALLTMRHTTGA